MSSNSLQTLSSSYFFLSDFVVLQWLQSLYLSEKFKENINRNFELTWTAVNCQSQDGRSNFWRWLEKSARI